MAYARKRRWQDGTTHVVMRPEVLVERLLTLVPRPRRHLVIHHGVRAPAAGGCASPASCRCRSPLLALVASVVVKAVRKAQEPVS